MELPSHFGIISNVRSQRAPEARGVRRDGVLRHHMAQPDGTVRDTVMYSILSAEWPDVERHLALRVQASPGRDAAGRRTSAPGWSGRAAG